LTEVATVYTTLQVCQLNYEVRFTLPFVIRISAEKLHVKRTVVAQHVKNQF